MHWWRKSSQKRSASDDAPPSQAAWDDQFPAGEAFAVAAAQHPNAQNAQHSDTWRPGDPWSQAPAGQRQPPRTLDGALDGQNPVQQPHHYGAGEGHSSIVASQAWKGPQWDRQDAAVGLARQASQLLHQLNFASQSQAGPQHKTAPQHEAASPHSESKVQHQHAQLQRCIDAVGLVSGGVLPLRAADALPLPLVAQRAAWASGHHQRVHFDRGGASQRGISPVNFEHSNDDQWQVEAHSADGVVLLLAQLLDPLLSIPTAHALIQARPSHDGLTVMISDQPIDAQGEQKLPPGNSFELGFEHVELASRCLLQPLGRANSRQELAFCVAGEAARAMGLSVRIAVTDSAAVVATLALPSTMVLPPAQFSLHMARPMQADQPQFSLPPHNKDLPTSGEMLHTQPSIEPGTQFNTGQSFDHAQAMNFTASTTEGQGNIQASDNQVPQFDNQVPSSPQEGESQPDASPGAVDAVLNAWQHGDAGQAQEGKRRRSSLLRRKTPIEYPDAHNDPRESEHPGAAFTAGVNVLPGVGIPLPRNEMSPTQVAHAGNALNHSALQEERQHLPSSQHPNNSHADAYQQLAAVGASPSGGAPHTHQSASTFAPLPAEQVPNSTQQNIQGFTLGGAP